MVSVSLIEDLKLREALTEISVHYNTIRQQNYVAQKSYNQKCRLLEWYRKNLMYARCVKKHLQDLHDENILDQNRTHAPLTSTYWVFFDNPSTRKDPISFMTSLDVQLGKIEQKSRQTISGLNRLLVHFHRLSALIRTLHLSCTERMGLQHVQRIKNAQSVSNDAITDLERVLIHYVVSLESEKRKRLQLEKTLKREKAKKLFLDACNILEMRQLNNVLT